MANVTLGTLRDYWKAVNDAIKTAGSAAGTTGIQVTGTDGTNARIIKTNATGEQLVQLLGSKAQVLKQYLAQNQHIGLVLNEIYGETADVTFEGVTPIDVSTTKKIAVYVKNSYNVAVLVSFGAHYGTVANKYLKKILNDESLAAGADKLWYTDDVSDLDAPFLGFSVGVYTASGPTTGTIDIIVLGGAS